MWKNKDKLQSAARLEKLGLRLVVAAESAARNAAADVAREVADAAASKLAELRRQLLKEVDRQRSSLEATAAELGMQAEAAAAMAEGAEAAAAVAETFSLRWETSQSEMLEAKETSAQNHADLQQRLASLMEVTDALGPKVSNLEEQLHAECRRLDAVEGHTEEAHEALRRGEEAVQRLSEVSSASREAWVQQRQALHDCFAEKYAASPLLCFCTGLLFIAPEISGYGHQRQSGGNWVGGREKWLLSLVARPRKHPLASHSEHADLGARLAELDKSSRSFMEEIDFRAGTEHCSLFAEATQALEAAWRPEATSRTCFKALFWDLFMFQIASAEEIVQVQEIRHELQASQRKSAQALESESARLTKALRELQRQGISHEWLVPRAHQRVEYLAMDSSDAKGIWMDSPEFWLGGQGPLFLRFYPQGVAGGDGLCAVGLYANSPASSYLTDSVLLMCPALALGSPLGACVDAVLGASFMLLRRVLSEALRTFGRGLLRSQRPLRLSDLALLPGFAQRASRARRFVPQWQAEGVLWLAHGFGTLELVSEGKEDLSLGEWEWIGGHSRQSLSRGAWCNRLVDTYKQLHQVKNRRHLQSSGPVADATNQLSVWKVLFRQLNVWKAQAKSVPGSPNAAGRSLAHREIPILLSVLVFSRVAVKALVLFSPVQAPRALDGQFSATKDVVAMQPSSRKGDAPGLPMPRMPCALQGSQQNRSRKPPTSGNPFLPATSAGDNERASMNPFIDRM
ncbi:IFI30 [Symbiodinium natans]|uniref:IFI30 protein n=1 Tax=Symbiodinium natans TaxID=878477 RepID=A0A812RK88_9DINO|nr:IFI30 [Symbiodinium natans]